ncbi:hypothetical protein ALHIDCOG_00044 [Klebsiella phage CPRSB]|nr:hypothetical protein ALHIDCOG_00044 [Klebsiella phage CPRSB]
MIRALGLHTETWLFVAVRFRLMICRKVVFPIKVTEYDVFGVKGFTDYFGTKFESESYIFTNSDRELFKKHVVVKEKPLLPKEDEAKEIYDLLNMLDNLGTCHLFGKRAVKRKMFSTCCALAGIT